MSNLYQYRYYCTVDGWQTTPYWNGTAPTTCYLNTAHAISTTGANAPQVVGQRALNQVTIQHENRPTGANPGIRTLVFNIPTGATGSTTSNTVVWEPIPTTIMRITTNTATSHASDVINIYINPHATIGGTTAAVTGATGAVGASTTTTLGAAGMTGTTSATLSVNDAVLNNAFVGLLATLTDATHVDELGQITTIDPVGKTITVQQVPSNSYAAGANVQVTAWPLRQYNIGLPLALTWGDGDTRGMTVAPSTSFRLDYQNNSAAAKTYTLIVEYLY